MHVNQLRARRNGLEYALSEEGLLTKSKCVISQENFSAHKYCARNDGAIFWHNVTCPNHIYMVCFLGVHSNIPHRECPGETLLAHTSKHVKTFQGPYSFLIILGLVFNYLLHQALICIKQAALSGSCSSHFSQNSACAEGNIGGYPHNHLDNWLHDKQTTGCETERALFITDDWKIASHVLVWSSWQQHISKELGQVHISHCVTSPLLSTTSVNIWELRRPAAGPLGEECCPILVW